MSKNCKDCKKKKKFDEFEKDKRRPNGITKRCLSCTFIYKQEYREKHKERIKLKKKNDYITNRKEISKKQKIYFQLNKKKINKRKMEKYHSNLEFRLREQVSGRLRHYLKKQKIFKNNSTILSIGLDKKMFAKWIEFNLKLDKLEEFHLDHFIPFASFNCKTYQEVIDSKCNHWTNIIPLTAEDNLKKGYRMPTFKEKVKMDLRIVCF